MNISATGKEFSPAPFTVQPERVAAFRSLFGERDGVPATFATAAEFTVMPHIVADPELGLDFSRVLHGNQEYEFRRPLREGERLEVRARIESIREMSGNAFLVIAIDLVAGNEIVGTARSTLIERSG